MSDETPKKVDGDLIVQRIFEAFTICFIVGFCLLLLIGVFQLPVLYLTELITDIDKVSGGNFLVFVISVIVSIFIIANAPS